MVWWFQVAKLGRSVCPSSPLELTLQKELWFKPTKPTHCSADSHIGWPMVFMYQICVKVPVAEHLNVKQNTLMLRVATWF